MTSPDLTQRSRCAELMDDPDVDVDKLDHALTHLQVINRMLNGYGPSISGIKKVIPGGCAEFSLLDVGCGSGDTLRVIARWARKRGLKTSLTGIELSGRTADRASEECRDYPEIEIKHQDLMEIEHEQFDIVHSALMLHHISDDQDAVAILHQMARLARLGIVMNDLHRHPFAWHSIHILTRLLSRSEILRNDAPLSVARSFTRNELQALATRAGLTNAKISWHWAFRWLLTARGITNG